MDTSTRNKIFVTNPYLDKEDVKAITDVAKSKWFSQGKALWDFEDAFAKHVGRKYALAVSSGSAADLLMIDTIAQGNYFKGTEIITTPLTYITTVGSIIRCGLTPVFVDVTFDYKSPNYLTIDYDKVKKAIGKKTKAIMPVHFLGFHASERLAELDPIVLEDCCNLGDSRKKLRGIAEAYSFFPAHHLCTGEGGMLTTDGEQFQAIARSLREYGRTCPLVCKSKTCPQVVNPQYICPNVNNRLTFSYLGWNLKMTNLSAALGLTQLKKIDMFMQKRRENAQALVQELSFLRKYGIVIPEYHDELSWFSFPIVLPPEMNKEDMVNYLMSKKIEARRLLAGHILSHPAMNNQKYKVIGNLDNSKYIDEHGFMIGTHPQITSEDIKYITKTFKEYVEK